jgi:hypothetical protein
MQAGLEQAEAAESASADALITRLGELGFPGTAGVPADAAEIERRIDAFSASRAAAQARESARKSARPPHEVEADLARLEAAVAAAGDPAWAADVEPADVPEPDLDEAREHRAEVVGEFESARVLLADIARLSDRRDAVERRVAVLTSADGSGTSLSADGSGSSLSADVEQVLLARLASARRVGPRGEPVTVILDEPFAHIKGERKWSILDTIDRLSASVQLVYLTDDVDVLVWARQRRVAGTMSLLEPAREPAAG